MHALGQVRDTLATMRQRFGRRIHPLSDPAEQAPAPDAPLTPTPIFIGQRTRIALMAAVVVAVVLLIREAPSILRLLLLGATLALIMSFPVRLLSAFIPRRLAILTVVSTTIAVTVAALIVLVPFVVSEISRFVTNLPETADAIRGLARDGLMEFYRRGWLDQHPDNVIEEIQGNLFDRGEVLAETLLTNVLDTLTRTFSLLITAFGMLFIATYLLIDIPRFRETFVHAFSPAYRDDAARLWSTLGDSLSRYLAGLTISILIQGLMATIGLSLLDVPYALVLGLWMSVTAILPYIGAFLGAIPAVLIALTISWETALLVTLLYVAINQLEGNLITPRIQGGAIRVHPLLIFLSIIAGTEIAGPLGAILAVPSLAVLRVVFEFLWDRLRIRQPQDTVLVALGGEDDEEGEAVAIEHVEDGAGEVDQRVKQETRPMDRSNAEVQDSTEVTVRVAANRRVPITRPRRRPRVRRHRKAVV